jgi:hypothetical protein
LVLALAREISHPFSVVLALNYLAMLHQFRRDHQAALETATEARNICTERGFDYYGAWSSLVRAWAIAESGQLEQGLVAYDAALEEFRRTSAGIRIPHHLRLVAAFHQRAGNATSALQLIDQAIDIAKATGESLARDVLASIYGWFCEGLETRDLVDARTLLVDLQ